MNGKEWKHILCLFMAAVGLLLTASMIQIEEEDEA